MTLDELKQELIEARKQIAKLLAELTEVNEDMLINIGTYIKSEKAYCTNGRSTAVCAGDWLVENAGWARVGKGTGRVQYYRPPNWKKGNALYDMMHRSK